MKQFMQTVVCVTNNEFNALTINIRCFVEEELQVNGKK